MRERLLIVLAVIAIAVIVARLQSHGTAVSRHRRPFIGLDPGIKVFASRSCDQCGVIESMVSDAIGPDGYTILWWDEEPRVFEANGIDRVPAIAFVGNDGSGWIAFGIPNPLRLRRWLGNP